MDRSLKGQELKKKIVFSLDPPNSIVKWPDIDSADQDVILDLLCSLLVPVGQHRTLYTQPSKGKRSRKRKRASPSITLAPTTSASTLPPPQPPGLTSFLTVGLNSTTRRLESMATQTPNGATPPKPRLLAVFACRSDSQPSQLHSHLPILCNVASRSSPEHIVRLVQLPKAAEARLATSLAIPQVGFLGLMEGAPGSSPLLNFLGEKVPPVRVPWLEGSSEYQPTAIKAMRTIAPPPPKILKESPVKTIVRVDSI